MLTHLIRRRTATLLAVLAVLAGGAALGAPAASASMAPAISINTPTVSGATATLDYSLNRKSKAVATLSCTLTRGTSSPVPADCGTLTSAVKDKPSTWSTTLSAPGAGTYTFTVDVTLTDGGTATASAPFTIALYALGRAACEQGGGTFTLAPGTGPLVGSSPNWACTGGQFEVSNTGDLSQACFADLTPSGATYGSTSATGGGDAFRFYCYLLRA